MAVEMRVSEWNGRLRPELPPEYAAVGMFLEDDVQTGDGKAWLELLNRAVVALAEKESMTGNASYVSVDAEIAVVENVFTGDECRLPTRDLRDLILQWVRANASHR